MGGTGNGIESLARVPRHCTYVGWEAHIFWELVQLGISSRLGGCAIKLRVMSCAPAKKHRIWPDQVIQVWHVGPGVDVHGSTESVAPREESGSKSPVAPDAFMFSAWVHLVQPGKA